jgi:hypothetical protein
MRSSAAIAAAVSTNASGPASKSAPSVSTSIDGRRTESCSSPTPFCSEMSLTPATSASGAKAESGIERARSASGSGLPYDADLEASGADAASPQFPQRRLGGEIGDRGRNRVEPCPECVRKAADCDLGVERLIRRRRIDEPHPGLRRQEPPHPRRTGESRLDAGGGHERQIAKELDGVAETVIVEHQNALARPSRPPPGFEAGAEHLAKRLSPKPARLVSLESAIEVPERQHEAAFARPSLATAERFGRLERRHRLGEAAETAQGQRPAAMGRRRRGRRRVCPAIGVERLLGTIELQKRVAEVDRRLGEIRAQRKRVASGFERLLEPAKLAQRSGAARPRVGVVRRERGRRFERAKRLVEPAARKWSLPALTWATISEASSSSARR